MIMIAGAGRARAGLPRPPVSGPRSKAKLSSRTRRTGILDCRGPGTDSEDSDAASRRCPQTPEAGASRRAGSRPRQAAPPAEIHVPAFAKGADGSVVRLDSRSVKNARPFRRPGRVRLRPPVSAWPSPAYGHDSAMLWCASALRRFSDSALVAVLSCDCTEERREPSPSDDLL